MAEEYWFTSEQGILRHHRILREQEEQSYLDRIARINLTESQMIEALRNSKDRHGWRLQQEANRFWSVYHGEAFRKGGFHSKAKAQAWMDDYRSRMAEVGAD